MFNAEGGLGNALSVKKAWGKLKSWFGYGDFAKEGATILNIGKEGFQRLDEWREVALEQGHLSELTIEEHYTEWTDRWRKLVTKYTYGHTVSRYDKGK